MTNQWIIRMALCLVYYHISGLATTNILRLTAGNTLTINDAKCACDNCGATISPFMQLPIISFIIGRGKCRHCGCRIPLYPLILEIVLFVGMNVITACFGYMPVGVLLSFVFYECIRVVMIVIKGKRDTRFFHQYAIAVLNMLLFFIPCIWLSLLHSVV